MEGTILVIDDYSGNREIIREALEKDYEILEANTQDEGKELFEKHHSFGSRLAAIVIDAAIPGVVLNTEGLVRELRAKFDGVILATTLVTENGEILVKAGASQHCTKNQAPEKLEKLLKPKSEEDS